MRFLAGLSAFLLSSCLSVSGYEYASFYEDALKHGCAVDLVPIYFANLDARIAGYCIGDSVILLNQDVWIKSGNYRRLEMVYHELGHCALNLDHSEPGLMAPVLHSDYEVLTNWDEWRESLFKNCQTIER